MFGMVWCFVVDTMPEVVKPFWKQITYEMFGVNRIRWQYTPNMNTS